MASLCAVVKLEIHAWKSKPILRQRNSGLSFYCSGSGQQVSHALVGQEKGKHLNIVAPSKRFIGKFFNTPLDVNRFSSTPSVAYRQVTRYHYIIPSNCVSGLDPEFLVATFMSFKNKFRGWLGERITSLINWAFLDSHIYRQLNNVTLVLADGSTTQIDHLIISKFGIFVVETKNMSGWIFGSANDRQWTQSFQNGKKFKFQNPIRQNYRHLCAIIEFLTAAMPEAKLSKSDIESKLFSVVFFGPDAEIKTKEKLPDSVNIGPIR